VRISRTPDGATVAVKVSAGAKRDAIAGVVGDALKISVQQAPEKGKANKAVAKVLAGALGVRPSAIAVLRGATSRDKLLLVRGADAAEVRAKLVVFGPQ
jgi:uncharacterized protein (TIGR00251 family)